MKFGPGRVGSAHPAAGFIDRVVHLQHAVHASRVGHLEDLRTRPRDAQPVGSLLESVIRSDQHAEPVVVDRRDRAEIDDDRSGCSADQVSRRPPDPAAVSAAKSPAGSSTVQPSRARIAEDSTAAPYATARWYGRTPMTSTSTSGSRIRCGCNDCRVSVVIDTDPVAALVAAGRRTGDSCGHELAEPAGATRR